MGIIRAVITLPITWFTYAIQLFIALFTSIEVKNIGYWPEDGSDWVSEGTQSRVRTFSEKYYRVNGGWWPKIEWVTDESLKNKTTEDTSNSPS